MKRSGNEKERGSPFGSEKEVGLAFEIGNGSGRRLTLRGSARLRARRLPRKLPEADCVIDFGGNLLKEEDDEFCP